MGPGTSFHVRLPNQILNLTNFFVFWTANLAKLKCNYILSQTRTADIVDVVYVNIIT